MPWLSSCSISDGIAEEAGVESAGEVLDARHVDLHALAKASTVPSSWLDSHGTWLNSRW